MSTLNRNTHWKFGANPQGQKWTMEQRRNSPTFGLATYAAKRPGGRVDRVATINFQLQKAGKHQSFRMGLTSVPREFWLGTRNAFLAAVENGMIREKADWDRLRDGIKTYIEQQQRERRTMTLLQRG